MQIMGKLLDRFGDGTPFVRAANDNASQAIMANLSNYGGCLNPVKLWCVPKP